MHNPVLLKEIASALNLKERGSYIDATFGLGGYSKALLETPHTSVVAIDRDPAAIAVGKDLSKQYDGRLQVFHGSFASVLEICPLASFDGIVFDLGVSSPQLDDADRGFSFKKDGPLDMRMSQSGESAADIVNTYSEKDLANLLWVYGEERKSRVIARKIIERRPFERTEELANLVRSVVPSRPGHDGATRTFQALRIAVNDELSEVSKALERCLGLLKTGGRLVVVSFHSLEDRIVKNFMRKYAGKESSVSRHSPAFLEKDIPLFSSLGKALKASEEETDLNPRARSAVLRWAERGSAPWVA